MMGRNRKSSPRYSSPPSHIGSILPQLAIIEDNGGDEPRAASEITYVIRVLTTGGAAGVVSGVTPQGTRYPDEKKTQPLPVGNIYVLACISGQCYLIAKEDQATKQCE